jgi:hypothetical protein
MNEYEAMVGCYGGRIRAEEGGIENEGGVAGGCRRWMNEYGAMVE